MEIENIMFSLSTMQWIVMAVIGVYSWLVGRQAASAKEMLELRMRITALETEIRQIPGSEQFNEVIARMAALDAQMKCIPP